MATRLRLGTRGSALAVTQSTTVADALRALGAEVELVTVRTLGDDRPPDTAWGEGAFVGALESALLSGAIDVAVHSAKDVPTTEDPRLTTAAYPGREDPRDALVGREPGLTLATVPVGARVGTDSPRRSAFLRAVRPDLRVHPLHGNVDSRLRKLDDGETDALVLAVAGLSRLGRSDRIGEILPADVVPPAPGQGALAVQCRADDRATLAELARIDDPATRAAVEAERAFLRATGGGCRAPIGALATIEGDELVLRAATAGSESSVARAGERPLVVHGEARGAVAGRAALAARLAARLTAELAGGIGAETGDAAVRPPRVLVTRSLADARGLSDALRARGLEPVVVPTIDIEAAGAGSDLDAAIRGAATSAWIVATSANAVTATLEAADRLGVDLRARRWAAVGPATSAALRAGGIEAAFVPTRADGTALATELPVAPGDVVLLPRSEIAEPEVEDLLTGRGARVRAVTAYRTVEGPEASRESARAALSTAPLAAVVFTSGSTVRGLMRLLGPAHQERVREVVACCIGPRTEAAARAAGFERTVVARTTSPESIADVVRDELAPSRRPRTIAPAGRVEEPA